MLALSKASYTVCGSYMASTTPSDILSILYIAIHLLVTTFVSILSFATLGILAKRSNTDISKLTSLYNFDKHETAYITTILQAIGFLGKNHK